MLEMSRLLRTGHLAPVIKWCVPRPRDRQATERKDNAIQGFSVVHQGGLGKRLSNAGVDRQDSCLFYRLSTEFYQTSPVGSSYVSADVI